jgi:anti-sigma regulatory factor (Ser/Thr protein kinase)
MGKLAPWVQGLGDADVLPPDHGVATASFGRMVVPATLDQLDVVNEFITQELEKLDCPMPVQMQLDVALEEMFVNVCHYAYKESGETGDCVVSFLCTSRPPAIVSALVDRGAPFDPLTRKDPTKPTSIQEAKIGGLGIFMTKKSVDDIAYARANGKNVVVFGKTW